MDKKGIPYKALVTTCIFWLVAKGISYKVWLLERPVPIMPPFEKLHGVPGWVHLWLFIISVSAIALLILKPSRVLLSVILISELFSCLLDQTRWQPWEYQYLFFIFIYLMSFRKPQQIIALVAFIICTIYFYSGLAKLNVGFLEVMWQNTILKRFFHLPLYVYDNPIVKYAGFALPITEMVCGFGLFFTPTRMLAAKLLIAMHVFILFLIGPLGINYNIVVWPWNVAMIIFLYILFIRNKTTLSFFIPFHSNKAIIILFWGILPAFSFAGYWDHYLSSHLYSGESRNLLVSFDNCNDDEVPYPLSEYLVKDKYGVSECGELLSVNRWYLHVLKVPCYPEERIFISLKKYLIKKYPDQDLHFFVKGKGVKRL